MKLIENWFSEMYSGNLELSFRVSDQLLSVKTDYQRIDVFDTYDFGKLLAIDGTVQLTERDEFVYHEMITMMPYYSSKGAPKSALVIGGGDGGAAGALLSIGLKKIVNVEIDKQVVEVSKKFFPSLYKSFKNPKVTLEIDDGVKYISSVKEKFDLIVIDSTDPVGPAEGLFEQNFYSKVKSVLSPGGIVVTQSGSPFYQPKAIKMAYQGLSATFKYARVYCAFIPTYPSGFWSFTMASDVQFVDNRENIKPGKYFNQDVYVGAPKLPQFVKDLIQTAVTQDKKKKSKSSRKK
ncbi:MAG: polyamine aminopropyltransferase [Thermoplasmatales archaeon]|nr:polyamine aminopropyltransferase [Thermoplasmatales archaeon]MCW6171179.1 polyamine aminopropyltransferase [Thermoplasmatales archaeon]